jgi:hypothetical protein
MSRDTILEFIFQALGEGEHLVQVASSGPPSLVIVTDFGPDDDDDLIGLSGAQVLRRLLEGA